MTDLSRSPAGATTTSNAELRAPSVCPVLLYRDAKAAIKLLTEGLGFTADAVYEGDDGSVLHAELSYGNGTVMLGTAGGTGAFAEATRGAGPTTVFVTVEDVNAHHERARTYGVEILTPPVDQDYGSRDYLARDPEGNLWSFGTYRPGQAQ